MKGCRTIWFLILLLALSIEGWAGGPGNVAGNAFSAAAQGKPLVWNSDLNTPVRYRTPSAGNLGKLDNASAVARVADLFKVWQDVKTASITFQREGAILNTGAYQGGAVDTAAKFDAIEGTCINAVQSPVVFDANGSLFTALGVDADVIGFAGPCTADLNTGRILASEAVLNGKWIDNNLANRELTDNQFDETFVHEFGHFIGLDHSQINLITLSEPAGACDTLDLATLPVMFPFAHCQARVDAGLPSRLAPDDEAWVSMLYPETVSDAPNGHVLFTQDYGFIAGNVLFTQGDTAQGVNVIALDTTANSKFSVVSGYLFTGNPGSQQVTGTNTGDGGLGSHDLALRGAYRIPVKAGKSYTLVVESIFSEFVGGSSVGPLFPFLISPAPQSSPLLVTPAGTTAFDVILSDSNPRFDQFEGK